MTACTANTANVWVNCPGSVDMSGRFPDLEPDAPRRTEGREWHAAAEALARDGELVGTPEQQEGAELWVRALEALCPDRSAWRVEDKLHLSCIHDKMPPGRPDWWAYDTSGLHVADYKAGHSYVSEFGHWQGLSYLIALAEGIKPKRDEVVTLTIVQPRYYGRHPQVRTWRGTVADLDRPRKVLHDAVEAAHRPSPPLVVGPWCRKCEGARGCAAFLEAAADVVDYSDHGAHRYADPDPVLTGRELQALHAAMQVLKDRADVLETQVLHFLQSGKPVAGYEMGTVQTRETWHADKVPELLALGDLLGVDLRRPAEPITPNQARKKGIDAAVIKDYAFRPAGAPKLLPVHPDTAKRIFNNGK